MIRFLLNIVRIIISIYLCAVVLLFAYFTVYKELYDDKFPMIQGYSYVKVPDDNLSPEYVKNDFVLVEFKDDQKVEVGDFVVYLKDNKYPTMKQVTKLEDYIVTLNYTNKKEESTINFDMIIAKAKYSDPTLSKVLNIITNPVVLIVLLVSVILIPELTYKRY